VVAESPRFFKKLNAEMHMNEGIIYLVATIKMKNGQGVVLQRLDVSTRLSIPSLIERKSHRPENSWKVQYLMGFGGMLKTKYCTLGNGLDVRPTQFGDGIFATKNFEKGVVVTWMAGKLLSQSEARQHGRTIHSTILHTKTMFLRTMRTA
jgi:hypothetical protein